MMEQISFCGTVCTECAAFLATQEDDDNKRREIAGLWSKAYGSDFKPDDINCDGCLSESGRHFNYCNVCEVRRCAQEKQVENCAHCDEYACEKLAVIFDVSPDNKTALDEIRKNL